MNIARSFVLIFGVLETVPLFVIAVWNTVTLLINAQPLLPHNLWLALFTLFHLVSLYIFKEGRRAGFMILNILYALRLIKVYTPWFFFNIGYGFNFYFYFHVDMLKGGTVTIGLNFAAILLLAVLSSMRGNFDRSKERISV